MICYPSRGMVRGFFALLLMGVLIGGLVTAFAQPKASAAASPGGVPVRVWFNPDPTWPNMGTKLYVELSAPAALGGQEVYLSYPLNPDKSELQSWPTKMTVPGGIKEHFIIITPVKKGWVAVLAKSGPGRAGGVLEIGDPPP